MEKFLKVKSIEFLHDDVGEVVEVIIRKKVKND